MSEIIVKLTGDHIKLKGGEYMQDLVRCKDCKFWKNKHLCSTWSAFGTIETEADDFCSYGERKSE